jgi:uncharacterized protein (TIGR03503 family)
VIRRKDFLDLVHITLRDQVDGGKQWEWQLFDDGKSADAAAGDGTFSHKLQESLTDGHHELTLLVDGTTFQREQRQTVNVYAQPVQANVTVDPDQSGHFVLSVIPYAGLIEPDSMEVTAVITDADGTSRDVKLGRTGPAEWRSELKDFNDPAGYQAEFDVTGNHSSGKPLSTHLGPYKFSSEGVIASELAPEPSDQQAKDSDGPRPQADVQDTAAGGDGEGEESQTDIPVVAETSPVPEDAQDSMNVNWFLVIGQVILINGLLIGGGFFAYKRWWRSDKNRAMNLVDDESSSGGEQPLASILEESKT